MKTFRRCKVKRNDRALTLHDTYINGKERKKYLKHGMQDVQCWCVIHSQFGEVDEAAEDANGDGRHSIVTQVPVTDQSCSY